MGLHAEVQALMERLEISYKNAAHCLYVAEVAKLNSEKDAEILMMKIRVIIDNTVVNDLYPPLMKIDSDVFNFKNTSTEIHK